MLTARLELRSPAECDRQRFIELFTEPSFMVFAGVCTAGQADERFDAMLSDAEQLPFTKQPIIEQSTGEILGYCGVASFVLKGEPIWEFGYRLTEDARGRGIATEAALAVLDVAKKHYSGTIYAMIDPSNEPSMRVIDKVGFTFWKVIDIDAEPARCYRLTLP